MCNKDYFFYHWSENDLLLGYSENYKNILCKIKYITFTITWKREKKPNIWEAT